MYKDVKIISELKIQLSNLSLDISFIILQKLSMVSKI